MRALVTELLAVSRRVTCSTFLCALTHSASPSPRAVFHVTFRHCATNGYEEAAEEQEKREGPVKQLKAQIMSALEERFLDKDGDGEIDAGALSIEAPRFIPKLITLPRQARDKHIGTR